MAIPIAALLALSLFACLLKDLSLLSLA